MSETGSAVSRPRRSRAEAEQLAVEYEASGLTRRGFCAAHDVSLTMLDKYLRRHRHIPAEGRGRMIPVEVVTEPTEPGPVAAAVGTGSGLWLELPKGFRIAVERGFDVATLGRLLTALAGA